MTDFKQQYANKVMSAQSAVKLIKPGQCIIYPIAPAEPATFHEALVEATNLKNNRLYRTLTVLPTPKIPKEQLKYISLFLGGDRAAYYEGEVDLLPGSLSDTTQLLKMREDSIVLSFTGSRMNEDGYISLGLSNIYMGGLLDVADAIIVEVNENCPFVHGTQHSVHISQVSAIIETDRPIPTLPNPAIDEKSSKIGQAIADLIPDNATLQIGYGAVPSAVMNNLLDKKGLGLHTEMLPDMAIPLIKNGAVTNTHKNTHIGKTIATFAFGSHEMYEWMDNNEEFNMLPVELTNGVENIAKEDNLYCINASIQVDLLGQCNSEKLPGRYYSSSGGQPDFGKGVNMTKHGVGIIALNATANNDKVSTIVPALYEGAAVTTSKNDVDYVVTEFGVAKLRGKTINERVEALINIAHPKFRDELREEAKKMYYLPQS